MPQIKGAPAHINNYMEDVYRGALSSSGGDKGYAARVAWSRTKEKYPDYFEHRYKGRKDQSHRGKGSTRHKPLHRPAGHHEGQHGHRAVGGGHRAVGGDRPTATAIKGPSKKPLFKGKPITPQGNPQHEGLNKSGLGKAIHTHQSERAYGLEGRRRSEAGATPPGAPPSIRSQIERSEQKQVEAVHAEREAKDRASYEE